MIKKDLTLLIETNDLLYWTHYVQFLETLPLLLHDICALNTRKNSFFKGNTSVFKSFISSHAWNNNKSPDMTGVMPIRTIIHPNPVSPRPFPSVIGVSPETPAAPLDPGVYPKKIAFQLSLQKGLQPMQPIQKLCVQRGLLVVLRAAYHMKINPSVLTQVHFDHCITWLRGWLIRVLNLQQIVIHGEVYPGIYLTICDVYPIKNGPSIDAYLHVTAAYLQIAMDFLFIASIDRLLTHGLFPQTIVVCPGSTARLELLHRKVDRLEIDQTPSRLLVEGGVGLLGESCCLFRGDVVTFIGAGVRFQGYTIQCHIVYYVKDVVELDQLEAHLFITVCHHPHEVHQVPLLLVQAPQILGFHLRKVQVCLPNKEQFQKIRPIVDEVVLLKIAPGLLSTPAGLDH